MSGSADRSELAGIIARHYKVVADVAALPDATKIVLGELGRCRFCNRSTERRFGKTAHTFPEALGNKTVTSRDECDACNTTFGKYEGHLCASIGILLTLGGTPGKGNEVRQTGRSKGPVKIIHRDEPHRRNSYQMNLENRAVGTSITFEGDQSMRLLVPAPLERFRPRQAYKALAKMALAIMPEPGLAEFKRLAAWLQDPEDQEELPFLDVGFSLASVGNAPRFVRGTLLRRKTDEERVPYMIFLLCAGSACWQIDVMPDSKDDHLGLLRFGCINIRWRATLRGDDAQESIELDYGVPRHFDWSSNELRATPIESVETHFDYTTCQGEIVPHFRPTAAP